MRFSSAGSIQYAVRDFSVMAASPSTEILKAAAVKGAKDLTVAVGSSAGAVVGGFVGATSLAEAIQYSLDGSDYLRADTSSVSLTGLAAGPHRLEVKAENTVGTADPIPRVLQWDSRDTSENVSLFVSPVPSSPSEFEVGGWSSGHYKWRLDGSPWKEAKESRRQFHVVAPNVMHFWEALPVTNEAVWSGPPLLYAWSVGIGDSHGRNLAVRDELTLTALQDGNHTLFAKAIDAAGICLPLFVYYLLVFQGIWPQQALAFLGRSTQLHPWCASQEC
jgi:hypothetical protein